MEKSKANISKHTVEKSQAKIQKHTVEKIQTCGMRLVRARNVSGKWVSQGERILQPGPGGGGAWKMNQKDS